MSLSSGQLPISREKGEEFHVPLFDCFDCAQVKFQDLVAWVNLLLSEAGIKF
jgi:hypothetical protein